MRSSKFILLIFLLYATPALKGQPYSLKHFQVEDGLSNNGITCSLQDKMGFMWFGTKDGLNRFDGYSFKTFRKTDGKPNSIGNNYIHCLYEDSSGTLWAGTEQGLYQYIDETEEFLLLPATANMYVDAVLADTSGNLWLISYYQLYRYVVKTKKLQAYDPELLFAVTCFCPTPDGSILVGTVGGWLEKYNPGDDSFTGTDLFEHSKPDAHHWVQSLYVNASGEIIAGTSDTEIKVIDPLHFTYTDITIPNSGQASLYIRSIIQNTPDEYWLGTESGVFIYNLKTGTCQQLQKNYNNPYSISDNAVYSMCKDREGGIWIGTYFGGVNYFPNHLTPMTRFFPQKGENSLSGNVIGEIQQDYLGNLWIATQDAGLNKYDPSTGKFTSFEPDGRPGSISFFAIHGLLATGNKLWVGTFEHGLDVLNLRSGKVIRHYEAGVDGFTHNYIYCIYKTDEGRIYIGTPHGAFQYQAATDRFEQYNGFPPRVWITSILEDESGNMWGSTFGNGLYYYSTLTGRLQNFLYNEKDSNGISSNRVTSLFEDSRQHIWVATEEGLCRYNTKTNNFTRFGTRNGFPSDFILSILEDDAHNLWISTTKGLVRFNPESGKIKAYNTSNGLISDQFSYNSAFKDSSGRMYFGTVKGMIGINPKEFRQNKYIAPIYLTGFQVNGQDVAVNSQQSPLKKSIIYTNDIHLTYKQSTFSIDFAALNYTSPEVMHYEYKMDGLSERWIALNESRRVDFVEIPAGTYTFRVRAMNSDGVWSKEATVNILVSPPWWFSKLAIATYVLLTILLVLFIIYYYHQRIKEKTKRKIELLEIAKEKELLESKIDFFTNVAHEIKTPLTLIKIPLSKVLKKLKDNAEVGNSLNIMNRNTIRLIELTNQLLDFRKTEINRFELLYEHTDISTLIKEVFDGFEPLSEEKNIKLNVQLPGKSFYATVDVDAFTKIIYNLFSNAVKYAATKATISLLPRFANERTFTIQVKNDGYLIPPEFKEKIFEPFFRMQATTSQTGTGIGLALAQSLVQLQNGSLILDEPDKGMNVFTLTLPIKTDSVVID